MIDTQSSDLWTEIGTSRAWNWQQGCMLQWLPGTEAEVAWNDREDGRFVTRLLDVVTHKRRFYLYEDRTENVEVVGPDVMTVNGHNTYVPGTDSLWVLNDAYPDADTLQHPYLFHIPTNRRVPLGHFPSPPAYRGELVQAHAIRVAPGSRQPGLQTGSKRLGSPQPAAGLRPLCPEEDAYSISYSATDRDDAQDRIGLAICPAGFGWRLQRRDHLDHRAAGLATRPSLGARRG